VVPMLGDKRATIILMLVLCFAVVSLPQIGLVKAEPKTIVVPDDYSTIQEAVDSASEGDIVYVKNGTYLENVMINQSLSLIGENWESVIIDANKEGTPISLLHGNVTVTAFTICNGSNFEGGVDFWAGVDYCNISNNRIINNPVGIDVACSDHNIIFGNYIERNTAGIELGGTGGSNYNNVSNNEIINCSTGISIMYSYNNSILQNKIENTRRSIHLRYSYYNDFIGNEIRDSKEITIALTHSNFNLFWFNNFVNNIIISDGGWVVPPWTANSSINIWDKEEKGNFWSDYNGSDDNEDGIGDVSYFIYGNNTDNYPLMNPVNISDIPEFPSWIILPLFLVASLVAIMIRKRINIKETENGLV